MAASRGRIFCFVKKFVKKTAVFILSIWMLSIAVFYAARLAPGDPLASYYGERVERMSPRQRTWAEEKLGLREPVFVQYAHWLGNALHGDFGISFKYKMDVMDVIRGRILNTLVLSGSGLVLIFVLSLVLGILCAWQEGRWFDRMVCRAGTIVSCIPEFWLSLVLMLVFSVWLHVLPGGGAYTLGKEHDAADRLLHLVLPLGVVTAGHLWYYAYMVRSMIIEEMRAGYVLMARVKGLGMRQVLLHHCLRNILPPYLSIMAVSVPHILGGTYIVEAVFSYPGIGTLSYESARYKDYNLLMILCIFSGALVMLCSLAGQAVSERIDPRMR